jgi:hypothetical protein
MSRTLIALVLLLLLTVSGLRASDVLERHIVVRFWQTPLKEALTTVAQKAGFEWSYNANLIDGSRKISLVANDWTVRETLFELLGDGYEFKSTGNYLILKKRKKSDDRIYGYIKDPGTGLRVAHATVYDRKTLRATTTDSNGYYQLRAPVNAQIAVTRLNYRDTFFAVQSQHSRLQKIELHVSPAPNPIQSGASLKTETERFFKAAIDKWNEVNVPDSLHRRYQVSFLPNLGTNHNLSAKVINDWSLNFLAGTSLGNRKLEVGGIGNFTQKDMSGVQAGGIFNALRGNVNGVQVAGIFNLAGDTVRGAQIAGIFNFTRHAVAPSIQAAGVFNDALEGTVAIQVAGVANHATQVKGLQAAGAVNVADSVEGIQVAAVVNKSRKVKGIQLGLFNSAKELQGIQIGLINRSGGRVLPLVNW